MGILPFQLSADYYGNGSLTSVVAVSTGVDPIFIGKPESIIMEQALKVLGIEKMKH